LIAAAATLCAGGSGLNIVVVVNQNSPNSIELGNYYCEKRQVPPQNLLRINWTGGNVTWTRSEFDTILRAPLNAMLAARQLTNQIDYVLLSMDIPYRVTEGGLPIVSGINSTTSCLHYGFKPDGLCPTCPQCCPGCSLPAGSASAYAGSEGIFRQMPPISASSNSWLVMMLTSSNLSQAKALVDRGVASDYSFPTEHAYLLRVPDHNLDPFRSVRYPQFDDAVFEARVRTTGSLVRSNAFPSTVGYQLGSQFGRAVPYELPGFAPGAMADNLTSYAGYLYEESGMTDALDYLIAGATASYGTVVEPCNYLEKFPAPRNYFYQARGFSIAECYYQSVTNPYQGILAGEPLAAPFALPCSGSWSNLPSNAVLAGATNLSLGFLAAGSDRPIQQVDLFFNGTFLQTITNIPPRTNNIVYVTLNGFPTNYTVPAGANLKSIATSLAARLNQNEYSNATKVAAFARGDRIELRSLALNTPGDQVSLSVSNSIGAATALTTRLTASRTNFLDTIASGLRNCVITNAAQDNSFLNLTVTKTNGSVVLVGVTNTPGNTDTAVLVQALVNAINADSSLLAADGVRADDFVSYNLWLGQPGAEFNLIARSPGWRESQIQAQLSGSANFNITPTGTVRLDENAEDLRPRNHVYVTAGFTNLPLTFGFNTTTQADGFHEMTAVAYEGSHVRTQKRISQNVRIQNTTLSATFSCLLCDTNTAFEATAQFSVVANTTNITRIELFSTGGAVTNVTSQSSAVFPVAFAGLGIGLHPFYAMVTRADGSQYRTETKWIRVVGPEPPFALSVAGTAPTLSWPATAGRRYEVMSATNLAGAFSVRDALTPSNSAAQWTETNSSSPQRHYRVRTQ
jgi:uncharacterized protein (TIGR03790 family)